MGKVNRSLGYSYLFALAFLMGCSTSPTRSKPHSKEATPTVSADGAVVPSTDTGGSTPLEPSEAPNDKNLDRPPFQEGAKRRLAVILGPGGARAYAHIGFLRELQRQKIEPEFVAGIEWSALPAALYAFKGYPNEAEWQMFKLDESSWFRRQFLPGETRSVGSDVIQPELDKIFGNSSVQNFKIKFVCPSWNMAKSQTYLMNRGAAKSLMPFCLPHPPLFKPHQNSVAALYDIRALVDHLRGQGATHVLYINLLEGVGPIHFGEDLAANALWSGHLSTLQRRQSGIDEVISIPLSDFSMRSFDRKKEIVSAGQKRVEKALSRWIEKMGY